MKKHFGTIYKSKWDASTWTVLLLVAVCCIWPVFLGDVWLSVIVCCVMLGLIVAILKSIYYRIDGDKLVVYQFFVPTAFPIDKIKEIRRTKSLLSAPATSLTDRIAITFTDRSILKSTTPLIISPTLLSEFIRHLLSVTPHISVELNTD